MKKRFLSACAALFALMVLCSVTTRAADNVYAILYDDGTLVFQHGNTPESGKTVTKTYEVDLSAIHSFDSGEVTTPWHNERESIRVVNFVDKISPKATAWWFDGCSNLERVDNIQYLDTANVTDMSCMFSDCSRLVALDVSYFDTAKVTDMKYMFYGCSGLMALNVSHFDTANVTNMKYMFSDCSGLTALDVSHFDTANVTDMWSMFHGCSGLTTLDVSHFNTANVTSMSSMFSSCHGLTVLDVSKFDTANVTNMTYMFSRCSGLTALDVSHFDTANVTNMTYMFWDCSGLTALDVSHFDTANVREIYGMFYACSNLKTIYASDKFTTASVTYSASTFYGCTSLVGGNGTKYDSAHSNETYARIDTPSTPGYFTASGNVETYVITSYAGEGGTVTPEGDTRVSAGDSQKYTITPNPGYAVRSVRVDGADMGALSEYTFKNVIKDHTLSAFFEKLPRYAITAAVAQKGELSVTLENDGAVTVAVSYFDRNGKFLSVDLQSVSANAGSVTFALPFAYAARVALFDTDFRPLCDPVTAE